MSRPVRASLAISFSSNLGSDVLQVETDDRPDGGNSGRTAFYPGDTVYLLEYKSPAVRVEDRFATDGGLVVASVGSRVMREFVTVSGDKTASTTKPIDSGLTVLRSWGRPYAITGYFGSSISLAAPTVAVLEVQYTAKYSLLRLSGSSGEAPVLIHIMGIVD